MVESCIWLNALSVKPGQPHFGVWDFVPVWQWLSLTCHCEPGPPGVAIQPEFQMDCFVAAAPRNDKQGIARMDGHFPGSRLSLAVVS
jgi:hypothetical protein